MTGFWTEPTVRENGWECLYNMYPSHKGALKGIYAMDFLHGYCTYFARALHDVLGYEMLAVYGPAEEWSEDDDDMSFGDLIHAYCVTPNGKFVDIRGICDDWYDFIEEFEDEIEDVYDPYLPISDFELYFEGDKDAEFIYEVAKEIVLAWKDKYI